MAKELASDQPSAPDGQCRPAGSQLAPTTRCVVLRAPSLMLTPPPTDSPAVTARQLAAGRWTRLPPAPISGRTDAAITWTGAEMLIWGGSRPDQTVAADGAAYNPRTGGWRSLPPTPLQARSGVSNVWAGSTWFIWGGFIASGSSRAIDGATYTPATNTWRLLPPSPITIPDPQVQTVWTGTRVVMVASPAIDASPAVDASSSLVQTASYDPTTNAWSSDADLVLPRHHPTVDLQLAAGGGHLYLWSFWGYTADGFGSAGTDTFSLDASEPGWKPVHLNRAGKGGIAGPIWTGTDFIQGATPAWRGIDAGPPQMNLTGERFNPATGQATVIPHGPLDDRNPQNIWTGGALIAIDTLAAADGPPAQPGRAEAWDPVENKWTRVPASPMTSDDNPPAIWAGASLLLWGQFYDTASVANPKTDRPIAVGFQFTPGTA